MTGAYPLDIDGDGRVDLAILRLGENVILRGLGGCRFERANEALGIDGGDGLTTAFSATAATVRSSPAARSSRFRVGGSAAGLMRRVGTVTIARPFS